MKNNTNRSFIAAMLVIAALSMGQSARAQTVNTFYLDADGTRHENVQAIPLNNTMTELAAGTYVVNGDVTFSTKVNMTGDVTLILADGYHMNIGSSSRPVNGDGLGSYAGLTPSLTIYAQSTGDNMGALSVYASGMSCYSIWAKLLTINGGCITAHAEGTGSRALVAATDITINGGTITATSFSDAIYAGSITLGGATVTSSSYSAGSITIANGIVYTDGTGATYAGTLTSDEINAIANKTLTKGMTWTDLKAALTAGGTRTVTLTNNVIRDVVEIIAVTGTVTLDLNGYTIDGNSPDYYNRILGVGNGVSLTITDSRTGGKICKPGSNETIWVNTGGTLTLAGGTIEGGPCGVVVDGRFIMTGGSITATTWYGVELEDYGTFTMSGGSITGNEVGVLSNSKTATFTVSGNVNITGNTTEDVSLYYDGSNFNPIHIGGALNEAARIGINIDDFAAINITGDVVKVITDGLSGKGMRSNFVLNGRADHALVIDGSGELAITPGATINNAPVATVLSENKYVSTFYNGTQDYQLMDGAKAYTASLDGSDVVVFHLIGEDGSVIPKGTAVIVVADAASITLTKLASTEVTAYAGNILQGSDTEIPTPAGTVYVLNKSGDTLGFYQYTGITIPAHKAYYVVQ